MTTLIEIVNPCQECEEHGMILTRVAVSNSQGKDFSTKEISCDDCDGEGYTREVFAYEEFNGYTNVLPDRKTEAALAAAREEWPDATCKVITYGDS